MPAQASNACTLEAVISVEGIGFVEIALTEPIQVMSIPAARELSARLAEMATLVEYESAVVRLNISRNINPDETNQGLALIRNEIKTIRNQRN